MEDNLIKKKENLLKAFIGKNYEKITTRQFNIPGFFFGSFYMFYRKMYLYGILVFVLTLIISNLFNNMFVGLLLNLLIALFVNKIYVSFAKNKISKIEKDNDKSAKEIEKMCKEKGGTSVLSVVLGFLIELFITGIFIGIAILLFGFNINNYFNKNNETPIVEDENLLEEDHIPGVYDGGLYFESNVDLAKEFSIEVPSVFTDNSYESSYGYEYENTEETEEFFKTCRLSMNLLMEYTSSEDLINQMAKFHKDEKIIDISNITINNVSWSWFAIKNDIGKTYYYATTKNNKVYILSYEVQAGAGAKCEEYRENIINSIKSI